ncbi:MAG: ResB-like family [Rhodobacteraceae bacterium HLUCCO07]|nr:MAG: ResB-like family [Rhodobacteraceae bacterium HLUCCO07]
MSAEERLARLTGMAYRSELARIEALAATERRLKRYLEELNDLGAVSDPDTALNMGLSSFDRGWHRWKAMKRAETNLRLADIRARKAQAAAALHRAHARNDVAQGLRDHARRVKAREATLKQMETLQDQALLAALSMRR